MVYAYIVEKWMNNSQENILFHILILNDKKNIWLTNFISDFYRTEWLE